MGEDWTRYWRSPDQPLEAMHAHFERHVYHRHSHESYSFGATDIGTQAFRCRGAAHASRPGMVMAFNPDDPHDGHAVDAAGFTYRIIHIGQDLVADIAAGGRSAAGSAPMFARPVVADAALASAIRRLHAALVAGAPSLRRDELLTAVVRAAVRCGGTAPPRPVEPVTAGDARRVADAAREYLRAHAGGPANPADLAAATGRSRFVVYRAFRAAYGMAPSDYERQLRLRTARRLIDGGEPIAQAAASAGFADQSHLTRWFTRCYGITPAAYRRATTT